MLDVRILDEAQDYLRTLPDKHARQILKKIELLARNPLAPKTKLLAGYEPLRRFRAGNYRIVYFVDGSVLKVPLIDKRNDDTIYRRLKQMFR